MGEELTTTASTPSPESLLDEVQRLAGIGFWEFDVPGNKVTWSPELHRIYGVDPSGFDATYEAFLDLVHADDRTMVDHTVQAAFATHDAWSFDHRIVRPDGQVRWLHGRGSVTVRDGQVVRMVGTGTDITDRKRTEQFLLDFVANASHELRTPTTAIVQAVDLLQGSELEALDDTVRQAVEVLVRQARRMQDLTTALLDLSHLTSGTRSMMLRREAVAPPLQAAAKAADPTSSHVRVEVEDGLHAHASAADLQRAVLHLLINAMEHGAPPIRVTAVRDGHEAVVVVEDAGPGVPEDRHDDLFTPFAGVATGSGPGLGLPIVRELVRAMGGSVAYSPTADAPGRFSIRLEAG